jgi:hypothetical protein
MKCKTFKYKNYGDCYFNVGSYLNNNQSMAISMESIDGEMITMVTVNRVDYLYGPDTATIKNYSENAGITKFLKKLGVIEEVYTRAKCNPDASKSETIDYCLMNIEKLKEYTNSFNYEWGL